MVKEITIAVISSLIGALIAFLGSGAMGLYEKNITVSQIQGVAENIVNNNNYRNAIIDQMAKSGLFKGTKGDVGPNGEVGPSGPDNVLALITVKDGKIERFSNGVSYDAKTGIVSFPNPKKLNFVTVVSDFGSHGIYSTTTNFLRKDFESTEKFKVWATPLDTSGRNSKPESFSAIVIGY